MNKGGAAAASGAAKGAAAAPAAASAGYTMEEVAKHNKKGDCWVVLNDQVLDVSNFLKDHPGGELAILTFSGKNATEEFNMIHPPDVIDKYLDPKSKLGTLGGGGGGDGAAAAAGGGDAAGGPVMTREEVAKHNQKGDCWIILHGQVIDVTKFLAAHPGGEPAIMAFAGKDATPEWDMIHKLEFLDGDKYVKADMRIGKVAGGGGGGAAGGGAKKSKGPWYTQGHFCNKFTYLFGTMGLYTGACVAMHSPFGILVGAMTLWMYNQEEGK